MLEILAALATSAHARAALVDAGTRRPRDRDRAARRGAERGGGAGCLRAQNRNNAVERESKPGAR